MHKCWNTSHFSLHVIPMNQPHTLISYKPQYSYILPLHIGMNFVRMVSKELKTKDESGQFITSLLIVVVMLLSLESLKNIQVNTFFLI